MSNQNDNLEKIYKDIKRRIRHRYEKRMEITIHVTTFIVLMIGIWGVWMPTGGVAQAAQIFSVLWFAGLIGHGIHTWFEERAEVAIDAQLEKYGLLNQMTEKAKRTTNTDERAVRLTDDGEIEDLPFLAEDGEIQNQA
jgi:hypothetical protein